MRKMLGVVLVLVAFICPATIVTRSILFQIKCGGHMSLASKANSIDLAKKEMGIVVKYLEDRNLTNGNTAILWDTPKRDLGFFYSNMKASLEELKNVSTDASSLEKSNILIKLRETLTEQGEKSENITAPNGIRDSLTMSLTQCGLFRVFFWP